MNPLLEHARLYAIVDLGYVVPAQITRVTRELIAGGAGVIQLRAKGQSQSDILHWALEIAPICRESAVPFIVNDYISIAKASDADGVHLGQEDGPLATARGELDEGKLVGRSTHSLQQANAALSEGADYIGFGPLFPTPTKQGRPAIGLHEIATVQSQVGSQIPVYCIGGIQPNNLASVIQSGARRAVVVSALLQAEDISRQTRSIVTSLQNESRLHS